MIRRRLGRALDWRLRAVTTRADALLGHMERLEERLDAATLQLRELAGEVQQVNGEVQQMRQLAARLPQAAADAATVRELVEQRVPPVLEQVQGLAATMPQAAADAATVRELVEQRVQPVLRAIVDEESQNRRRLHAMRGSPDYQDAYRDRKPLVSITLATRDRPELLANRALPSLLAQTHAHLEVLVVGDAASPDVAEAVAALGDSRVSYANLSQRIAAHSDPIRHWLVGSTMARNEAARRARGSWLLHFDDDDELRPDAIASLLEVAREQRAEVAYGGFDDHRSDGQLTTALAWPPTPGQFGWQGALIHGGLRFFERELFAAYLPQPGDLYLLERMLRVGVRFAMLDRVVWDYFPSESAI